MPLSGAYFTDRSQEIGMAEVIVPPTSDLIGKTLVEAGFRTRFGLTVVGLRRGIVAHQGSLLDEALKTGDTLLLIGPWKDIEQAQVRRSRPGHHQAACRTRRSAPGRRQGAAGAGSAWRSSSA